jgi:hypothetical protein
VQKKCYHYNNSIWNRQQGKGGDQGAIYDLIESGEDDYFSNQDEQYKPVNHFMAFSNLYQI